MHSYRPDETFHRLREWTYGQAPSERLMCQIAIAVGYNDIDPSHPLGGPDGGKDAISFTNGKTVFAAYFPFGQQQFPTIKKKFLNDLIGAKNNQAIRIAFVTNQLITNAQRNSLIEASEPLELDLFHLERITQILDTPVMEPIRRQFLHIDRRTLNTVTNPTDFNTQVAANFYQAISSAQSLVLKALPSNEFLTYLESYDFYCGRVPIDKHNALNQLYDRILHVKVLNERCELSKRPDIVDLIQTPDNIEILTALPALGHFFHFLEQHCKSINDVTCTELGFAPTHLGIFDTEAQINTLDTNFRKHVTNWKNTARELAASYRTVILGQKSS